MFIPCLFSGRKDTAPKDSSLVAFLTWMKNFHFKLEILVPPIPEIDTVFMRNAFVNGHLKSSGTVRRFGFLWRPNIQYA
jgi:hypothetical protein